MCWSLRPFLLGSVTLLVGAFTPCSIHDDCREVDFCHKSGRCLPCIQCQEDARDAAGGLCPCGHAKVARVKRECTAKLKSYKCLGLHLAQCRQCALQQVEALSNVSCTVPFVDEQCKRAAPRVPTGPARSHTNEAKVGEDDGDETDDDIERVESEL